MNNGTVNGLTQKKVMDLSQTMMEAEMYSFISQLSRVKDIRHLLKVSRLHSTQRKILRVVQEQELLTL